MTQVGRDDDYRFCLSLASLLTAEHLADAEPDEQRSRRKHTVAQEKWSLLRDTFPAELGELHGYGGTGPALRQLRQTLEQVTAAWATDRRWSLLIDLIMSDAFAPYELRVGVGEFCEALAVIATILGLGDEHQRLIDAWSDALRAYRPSRWRTVIAHTTSSVSALTTSGPDPATAAALATAAGFSGTAATAHGIALLGGGSLAVGGGDLAAGMWLVTTSADEDAALPGGAAGLVALGQAQARVEVIKLTLNFNVVIRPAGTGTITEGDVIDAMARMAADLHAQLEVEHRVNDDDAQRIRDITATAADVAGAQRAISDAHAEAA